MKNEWGSRNVPMLFDACASKKILKGNQMIARGAPLCRRGTVGDRPGYRVAGSGGFDLGDVAARVGQPWPRRSLAP